MTLEEAKKRILELEKENEELREKLQQYEGRDWGGRRKHDAKWMASYEAWASLYESGKTIAEIVNMGEFSRRTCYRYKAYYEELKEQQRNAECHLDMKF